MSYRPEPLTLGLGSVTAPSYSFAGDTNTGLFSPGADQLALSTGGTVRLTLTTTTLTTTVPIIFPAGATTAPSMAFTGDTNTGFWSDGADQIAFSLGGVQAGRIAGTTDPQILMGIGGGTVPHYSAALDSNTGLRIVGGDLLELITGGTPRLTLTTTGQTLTVPIGAPNGTAAAPAYSFSGELTKGVFGATANAVSISAASTEVARFVGSVTVPALRLNEGNTTLPQLTGLADTDTGLTWLGANTLDIVAGGTMRVEIDTTQMVSNVNILANVDRGLRFASQTDQAGASVGTLTNAPAAGNPAFWVPIVVNGTNRSFPVW